MKEKGDECIFMGYSTQSRSYRMFNNRTRVIKESIHVNSDELPHMASDQLSSDLAPECQNMALNHDSLSPAIQRHENVPQADRTVTTLNELDLLFSPMFDELLNESSKVVSKSSAEELYLFDQLDVWELVDRPLCTNVINLKWLWKNKCDEENTVIRNKSRLVAKGYAQKEGVDFEESFAPVARLKKALYGLKQVPKAWYDELSKFLLSKGFTKGIQIYQSPLGIFINQAKYAQEILKKHGMTSYDSIGTPMATKHLDADLSGTPIDQTKYHSKAQPTKKHLTAVKQIFRYLKDTIHMGL
nr:hypothetical protein [Tanacetum cinerariifolium]